MSGDAWRSVVADDQLDVLGVLWGKSNAGGRPNLLLQHLFDTMAVAGVMWNDYVAEAVRARLDDATNAGGRRFFRWLCGLHDIGKASPAFQSQDAGLAARVQAVGLPFAPLRRGDSQSWRHEKAGALVLRERMGAEWSPEGKHASWVWPLIAGHHGRFPRVGEVDLRREPSKRDRLHGGDGWGAAQRALVDVVTAAAGYASFDEAEPAAWPTRADQLLVSGLIVMADWLASDEQHFEGIDDLDGVGVAVAEERAELAWSAQQMHGGWGRLPEPVGEAEVFGRFSRSPRPSQSMVVEAARRMVSPGLLVVEAPMGEGKTEAALAAAEVLAARFGAHGVFVGLPTQATSDPMFSRVRAWLATFDPEIQVALLHGKRRFNREWEHLVDRRARTGEPGRDQRDVYGMDDGLPSVLGGIAEDADDGCDEGRAASAWFDGPKRGLLAPNVVGTLDQLLYAGTRTRHVMVRYAGLAGKVVILDEVHAADVYMSQFLDEVLRWLGQGRVSVILLSATLSPEQRRDLMKSYVQGAAGADDGVLPPDEGAPGYPRASAAWVEDGRVRHLSMSAPAWRASERVAVEVVEEAPDDPVAGVVATLRRDLVDGGCALVIRNTVDRAQATYEALGQIWPRGELVLLHGRLSAAARADITERLVRQLDARGDDRPDRLVVVATQVAEQSFDIDADLLVTDLAPVDLLLQRVGRIHRHARPIDVRPLRVRSPRMVVTGVSTAEPRPWFPGGSEAIYSRYLLLRSLALLLEGQGSGWELPTAIPDLVARCYGDEVLGPDQWAADIEEARGSWSDERQQRAGSAKPYLLAEHGQQTKADLGGLHQSGVDARDAEESVRVRDGEMGAEVVLLRRDEQGLWSLHGTWLGSNGERGPDEIHAVVGGTVRVPVIKQLPGLTPAVERLGTLPEWSDRRWLQHFDVLVLDEAGEAELAGAVVRYDDELGLQVRPA